MGGVDPLFLDLQEALLGRYSLERELGRGGMGIVYLARDVSLDRLVAIKLLPPALAERPALRERFLREARFAARLSHPNIVPIHAVEEKGRLVWFVMAYVPGQSLGEQLRARGALPVSEVTRVLRDIAWALGYAHTQGVIHRDVKPDNILLESGGRRALIADFGIAASLDDTDETRAGTVAFLSPEQAHGERVDGRSDLYALGVVGYLALSSRLPYPVTTLSALVDHQVAGPPPALASVAPHLPRALTRIIDRCLQPLPTVRFQRADELADALQHLGGAPTDLPAPFRVWISRGEQPRGALLLLTAIWGVPILIGSLVALAQGHGGPGFMILAAVPFAVTPWALFLGARLYQTRRLLKAGYTHADLVAALGHHVERRREERTFEFGRTPSRVGYLIRYARILATAIAAGGLVIAFVSPELAVPRLLQASLLSGAIALVTAWLGRRFPAFTDQPRDPWAEFSLKFWRSGIGKVMTRLAGLGLTRRQAPEELIHRPTEIALGEAAEALFRALPHADRKSLRNMPEEIRHLMSQVQRLRGKIAELDDLIATAAPSTVVGERGLAGGDGGAAELVEARDLWAARLRETMAVLESVRVGLLRLHAGQVAADTLTADLEAARDLQERLGRLLAGHAEADRLLSRTPV